MLVGLGGDKTIPHARKTLKECMKQKYLFSLIAIIGLFLSYIFWIKFSPLFRINLWKPDFNLIILFTLAQIFGRRYGLLAGAYIGFMEDFSTSFFGIFFTKSSFSSSEEISESCSLLNFLFLTGELTTSTSSFSFSIF